jgi:tRNA 2-selenouridine synthase
MPLTIYDFLRLRRELPVLDVRSEGEFVQGNVSGAANIPILNNEERRAVGIDYKQKGQREAILTGFRLVGPRMQDIILNTEQIANGRELLVYCWRGGMRSNNFCQIVGMARVKSRALQGGYKSFRQKAFETFAKPMQLLVVGGSTGSGKSEVLRALKENGEQVIDLEALANHKGSAFGALMQPPQPTTEQFHNNLFDVIYSLDTNKRIWIEDESITIGKVVIPPGLWATLSQSPVIELDVDKQVRIDRLVNEYGPANKEEFLDAMTKITKRLGGQYYKAAAESLSEGDMHTTIDILLTYYDKAYSMGLTKKKDRIIKRVPWNGKTTDAFVRELINATPQS